MTGVLIRRLNRCTGVFGGENQRRLTFVGATMTAMKFALTGLRWLALAAFGGCLMVSAVLAQSLEIVDLKHRTAQEVIPVLQPLLESGGALSGTDYKLFVRASAANVVQLRQALAEIDRQPRQLLVSVRRATQQELQREGVGVSGVIGNDKAAVTVHATDESAQRRNAGVASVQVLEGSSAFIATGESVPLVTAIAGSGGRRPWVAGATMYRDLSSGFLVTPRIAGGVSGDRITLDIAQQAERRSDYSGNVETQQLSTQVSARLGEWMQLGSVNESSNSQRNGVLSRQYATQSDERSIWVKVESR